MLVFQLKSYNAKQPTPQFYIQCKGDHSGRPLKKPIPNCFSVYTNIENLYSLVYVLYIGGLFKKYISGSVVPFIRLGDVSGVIREHYNLIERKTDLEQVYKIDALFELYINKANLIKDFRRAYCLQTLKKQ